VTTVLTEAEKLHQRAAEMREAARAARLAGNLKQATILMRQAGTTLRRARRMAQTTRHGGSS